ncbi:hypothetical protein PC128_g24842 [Phytophthora cactorum]|nr:hypothetical protein PC128_g24842 [Phytophthora cactorum]
MLKRKIGSASVLRHFDTDMTPVVVIYACDWSISAALVQVHDGVYMPVNFTSRTLKSNELNYGTAEKEVLALLRILDVCYSLLVPRSVKVLTRYSTLVWLMRSPGLQGKLGNWATLLSPSTLKIVKCTRGEDEIRGYHRSKHHAAGECRLDLDGDRYEEGTTPINHGGPIYGGVK